MTISETSAGSPWGKISLEPGQPGHQVPTTTNQTGDKGSWIGLKRCNTIELGSATPLATTLSSFGATRSFWAADTPSTTTRLGATPRTTSATTGLVATCLDFNRINRASLLAAAMGCLIRIDTPDFVLQKATTTWEHTVPTANRTPTLEEERNPGAKVE